MVQTFGHQSIARKLEKDVLPTGKYRGELFSARQINKEYLLIDPFSHPNSGVTAYTLLAKQRLISCGIDANIISIRKYEGISQFRKRISKIVSRRIKNILAVEAPETLASTLLIQADTPVHIRLHCSKAIGQHYEGRVIDTISLDAERSVLKAAQVVSAPSIAAVRESLPFLPIIRAIVYPNPLPTFEKADTDRDIDILFLGRFQDLKGPIILPLIRRAIPEAKIIAAGPNAKLYFQSCGISNLPEGIEFLPEVHGDKKFRLLTRTKVVIIPSLFETSSMVAGEALASGARVVCWSHTGISEITNQSAILTTRPWDIGDFVRNIKKSLSTPNEGDGLDIVLSVNEQFDLGAQKVIRGLREGKLIGHNPYVITNSLNIDVPQIPDALRPLTKANSTIRRQETKMALILSTSQKKLRKLRRDPIQFFLDSRMFRHIKEHPKAGGKAAVDANTESLPALDIKTEPLAISPTPKDSATDISAQPTRIPALNRKNNSSHAFRIAKGTSFIKVPEFPNKSRESRSIFFLNEAEVSFTKDILSILATWNEFQPFRNGFLFTAEYSPNLEQDYLSIVNRFDVSSKSRFQNVQNLIFCNGAADLLKAIRSCEPYLRIMHIITPEAPSNFILDPLYNDVVICPHNRFPDNSMFRRKFLYDRKEEIPFLLRRAVQESLPKPFNHLLPVYGEMKYSPELFSFDTSKNDGLLQLSESIPSRTGSFRSYLRDFAERVEVLLLSEQAYLRYRSICDSCNDHTALACLLEFTLFDGIRYDVRT